MTAINVLPPPVLMLIIEFSWIPYDAASIWYCLGDNNNDDDADDVVNDDDIVGGNDDEAVFVVDDMKVDILKIRSTKHWSK